MSREVALVLVGYVALAGLAALIMKIYLMYLAIKSRGIAEDTAPGAPERLVAADVLIVNVLGIVMALAVMGLGGVFVYAVLNSAPADGTYNMTQGTILLLILLITQGTIEAIRGAWGIISLRLISASVASLRAIPDQCAETTFEGCPYISADRKESLRSKAVAVVMEIDNLPDAHK